MNYAKQLYITLLLYIYIMNKALRRKMTIFLIFLIEKEIFFAAPNYNSHYLQTSFIKQLPKQKQPTATNGQMDK